MLVEKKEKTFDEIPVNPTDLGIFAVSASILILKKDKTPLLVFKDAYGRDFCIVLVDRSNQPLIYCFNHAFVGIDIGMKCPFSLCFDRIDLKPEDFDLEDMYENMFVLFEQTTKVSYLFGIGSETPIMGCPLRNDDGELLIIDEDIYFLDEEDFPLETTISS